MMIDKRRLALTVIAVLLGVCTMLSVSYAYYTIGEAENKNIAVEVDIPSCAELSLSGDNTLNLSGDNAVPITDTKALEGETYRYSFSVVNGCTTSSDIKIALAPTTSSTMPIKALKYALIETSGEVPSTGSYVSTGSNAKALSTNLIKEIKAVTGNDVTTGYELSEITISANETKNYYLYLWIDYYEGDTTQTGANNGITLNKEFSGHLIISSYESLGIDSSTLAGTIMSLASDRDETQAWQVINENGYRYEGDSTTENNLCLDEACEIPYRIIGVFETPYDADGDGTIEDGEIDYLVKVIPSEPQPTKQRWNSTLTGTNYNDWTTSALKGFMNSTSGDATDVYVYVNLSDDAKNSVAKVRWYLGNVVATSDGDTAEKAYNHERMISSDSSIYDGNYEYYDDYIGLIYPSDYGYATLSNSCRNYALYTYGNYTECYSDNWLFFSGANLWAISPSSQDSNYVTIVKSTGGVWPSVVTTSGSVNETFYLIPSVTATGDGSEDNPYVLN